MDRRVLFGAALALSLVLAGCANNMPLSGVPRSTGAVAQGATLDKIRVTVHGYRPSTVKVTSKGGRGDLETQRIVSRQVSAHVQELEQGLVTRLPEMAAKRGVTVVDPREDGVPMLKLSIVEMTAFCDGPRFCHSTVELRGDLHVGGAPSSWHVTSTYGQRNPQIDAFDAYANSLLEVMQRDGLIARR